MFVQIGNRAFNPDLVVLVRQEEETRQVTLFPIYQAPDTGTTITFSGTEYDAFINWWYHKENVYIVSVSDNNADQPDTQGNSDDREP